jgi:hypothetical protein
VTTKPIDSPFWRGLMNVKEDFSTREKYKVAMVQKQDFERTLG